MNYLHYLDMFGIEYKQPYILQTKVYKSGFGGILTIILYSLSLLYFIYRMSEYFLGNINPKTSFTYEIDNQIDLQLNYPLITIEFDETTQELDPFNQINNIVSIYLIQQQNQTTSIYQFQAIQNQVSFNNLNISLTNQNNSLYPVEQILMFQICQPQSQNNCASSEKIQQFLDLQGKSIKIVLTFLYFNTKTNSFQTMQKIIAYAFESTQTLLNYFSLELQNNKINTGFLFDDINEVIVVNDAQIVQQTVSQNYFMNYFSNLILVMEFQISSMMQIQSIQYPKISEILADVGSIISTLMFLGIVGKLINEHMLQELITEQVISCYYPQFKELIIKRNIIGQIQKVFHFKNEISLDEFNTFYIKAKQIAIKKQTIVNQIYEISRLQFLVQQIVDKSKFNSTHKLGIPLNLELQHKSNTIVPLDDSIQVGSDRDKIYIYNNEDFHMLTLENGT